MCIYLSIFLHQCVCVCMQMVVEEKFVKGLDLQPATVVTFEGFYGAVVMASVILPLFYVYGG
jgi:hypothetical protein